MCKRVWDLSSLAINHFIFNNSFGCGILSEFKSFVIYNSFGSTFIFDMFLLFGFLRVITDRLPIHAAASRG